MFDLDFILDRYNYWIVILLMMTGLYIVISRGNLVKKIVGLNIFQTSVFIYYISISKVAGGTAPILIGDYGGGHHDEPHAAEGSVAGETLHAAPAGAPPGEANDLAEALRATPPSGESGVAGLHDAPANPPIVEPSAAAPGFETAPGDAAHGADALLHQAAEIVYSNPLPHVLILTAIVVGVATTAVGLALAVRIREAYGTVEEDELEAADNVAEFGDRAEEAAA